MRQISFYSGILPNVGDNPHFVPTSEDRAAFLTAFNIFMHDNLHEEFYLNINNYRVNEGVIIIGADKLTAFNKSLQDLTYALETEFIEGEVKYLRGYHITRSLEQSGNVLFFVSVDLWLDGIFGKIGNMHMIKTNKKVSVYAFYEEPLAVGALETLSNWRVQTTFTPSQVSIVFLLAYNVSQGVFSDEKISRTEMFAATLQQCIDACNLAGLVKEDLTAVEMALDIIGGVYGVDSNTGGNEAAVLKAWIVPTSWITYGDVVMQGLKVKSMFTASTGNTIANLRNVIPSFVTGDYSMNAFQRFVDFYPNLVAFFGPKYNAFKLPRHCRYTGQVNAYYRVSIGQDDIQVILANGEQEKDISQNFEVRLTTANNVANDLQSMARDLSFGFRFSQGVFGGYEKGGASGAFLSGATSLVSSIRPTGIEKANGSGDGFATWNDDAARSAAHTLKHPFYFMYYQTNADEKMKARNFGVLVDNSLNGRSFFVTLDQAEFVETPTGAAATPYSFVQLDYIEIAAQQAAEKYIQEEFSRGVYVVML